MRQPDQPGEAAAPLPAAVHQRLRDYYAARLAEHGPTAQGVDWASPESQTERFEQLLPLLGERRAGTLIDYGAGYGALLGFLRERGYEHEYWGYDVCTEALQLGRRRFAGDRAAHFVDDAAALPPVDYCFASGTFNAHFGLSPQRWLAIVHGILAEMWSLAGRGIAFNALRATPGSGHWGFLLFFADPAALVAHCRRALSPHVELREGYGLADFTVIVRREPIGAR